MRLYFGDTWLTGPTPSERANLLDVSGSGALQIEDVVRGARPAAFDRGNRRLEISVACELLYATAEAAGIDALTRYDSVDQIAALEIFVGDRQLSCDSAAITSFRAGSWNGVSCRHEYTLLLLDDLDEVDPPVEPDQIATPDIEFVEFTVGVWEAIIEFPVNATHLFYAGLQLDGVSPSYGLATPTSHPDGVTLYAPPLVAIQARAFGDGWKMSELAEESAPAEPE